MPQSRTSPTAGFFAVASQFSPPTDDACDAFWAGNVEPIGITVTGRRIEVHRSMLGVQRRSVIGRRLRLFVVEIRHGLDKKKSG